MWNGGDSWTSSYDSDDVTPNGDDTYHLEDTWSGSACDADWNLTFDADPFVIASFGITNTTSVIQTFTLVFNTPVSPAITINTVYGGSTGGSLTDNSTIAGLATASTVNPAPFYAGIIDSTTVLSLYADPTTWTAPFEGGTANILATSSGLPGPTLPNGPVSSSISIKHKFTLTPGDAISGTSYLVVTPEPATILMLGLGGLAILRKRRT
jgi:hypothetical protein